MSSSASQNNKNQVVTYKGRVLHTQNFSALCASDPELKKIAEAFKQFWKKGYHPDMGKDAAFARPKEILNLNEWKGLPLDMRLINFRAIIG